MEKLKIEVTYKIENDVLKMETVDALILEMMKPTGATWKAQGYSFKSRTRDICFEKVIK